MSCIAFQFGFAQQTINFEADSGYTLGNIDGQNGWVSTSTGPGSPNIANQVISTDQAKSGTQSLKITEETLFGPQEGMIIGGFYNYATPVPTAEATFSADIYMDELNASNFAFQLVDLVAGNYLAYIAFEHTGTIYAAAIDGINPFALIEIGTWQPNTWYNFKMETTGTSVSFVMDDVELFAGQLSGSGDVTQVRFVHNNFGGNAYIDNFATNDEPTASVGEVELSNFAHFYNKNTKQLNLESSGIAFSHIQLFNTLGQEVLKQNLSQTVEQINLSNLNDGVYIAKVSMDGISKTVKFIKQ